MHYSLPNCDIQHQTPTVDGRTDVGSSSNQTVHIVETDIAQRSLKNLGHILTLTLFYPPRTFPGFLGLSVCPFPLGGFATVVAVATTVSHLLIPGSKGTQGVPTNGRRNQEASVLKSGRVYLSQKTAAEGPDISPQLFWSTQALRAQSEEKNGSGAQDPMGDCTFVKCED